MDMKSESIIRSRNAPTPRPLAATWGRNMDGATEADTLADVDPAADRVGVDPDPAAMSATPAARPLHTAAAPHPPIPLAAPDPAEN